MIEVVAVDYFKVNQEWGECGQPQSLGSLQIYIIGLSLGYGLRSRIYCHNLAFSRHSSSHVVSLGVVSVSTDIQKSTYRSRQELQVNFLLERMGEFRSAALKAKKNNDLELAKHYIRVMKVLCKPVGVT